MLNQKIVLCLDCDYFFAQCEETRNLSLRFRPVVVCIYSWRTTDSGTVSTSNYAARKQGIVSGMPIFLAKKKASKDAVFLPADHKYYNLVSQKIMNLSKMFSGKIEQKSIDEAFLDITEKTGNDFSKAEKLALQLKQEIKKHTSITVSIGIGPNKLVSKIASAKNKPDGLTVVPDTKIEFFMEQLNLLDIPGIGTKTAKQLENINVNTIQGLKKIQLETLSRTFGKNKGLFLFNCVRGIDFSPVKGFNQKKQLSIIRTLKNDCSQTNQMLEFLEKTAKELHSKVIENKVFFKTLFIVVVDLKLGYYTKTKTFTFSSNSFENIFSNAKQLFDEFFKEKKLTARRAGIGVSGFGDKTQRTILDFS